MKHSQTCQFLALAFAATALAQTSMPIDQPYPGMIALHVDLTDAARKIFRVHEVIPAKPGPLLLRYPRLERIGATPDRLADITKARN